MTVGWKIAGLLFLTMAISMASFGAGFKVEVWRNGAAQAKTMQANLVAQQKAAAAQAAQIDAINTNFNTMVGKINDLNAATQHGALVTQNLLEEQSDAFNAIKIKLAVTNVGTCNLNDDADRLLQSAYQSAFPAGPAAAAGSASTTGSAKAAK